MGIKSKEHFVLEIHKEEIDIWYRAHNIVRERSELYHDFILSLLNLIDKTYLGADALITEEDIINHFNWCFTKIIDNFAEERIYFVNKGIFTYLWFFFYKGYYLHNEEDKVKVISEYFDLIFDYNKIKLIEDRESFIELYKLFDQNLKKLN